MRKPILSRRNLTFGGISSLATLALLGKSNKTEAAAPEHPNVAVVQRYYEAYGASDIELIRNEIFADDIIWTIPGHHPLAGTKQGADEVFAFFEQLNTANFKAEVLFLGGNDNYVVDVHRGWSNLTDGENIDQTWALLYEVEGDRIKSAVNFPGSVSIPLRLTATRGLTAACSRCFFLAGLQPKTFTRQIDFILEILKSFCNQKFLDKLS